MDKTKRVSKAHVSNIFFQNKIFVLQGEKQFRFVNQKQVLVRLISSFQTVFLVMDFKRALLAFNCSNRQRLTHRWHLVTSILVSSLQVRRDRRICKNPNPFSFFCSSSASRRNKRVVRKPSMMSPLKPGTYRSELRGS